jgi:hypothetical protein
MAKAMGLPHKVIEIGSTSSYLEAYRTAIQELRDVHGIQALLTGNGIMRIMQIMRMMRS